MKAYLLNLWDRISGSYWFVPALCLFFAILLALILPDFESRVLFQAYEYPEWMLTTVAASRTTLSVIFTAMLGITGTVFSITIVVLSLTSQQYGPRLLRGFLHDSATQMTLGSFLATTTYSLLLLSRLEAVEPGVQFSLHFSVFFALVLTLSSIALLVYYINHIAVIIQAPEIIQSVSADCFRAVARLYPEQIGSAVKAQEELDVEDSKEGDYDVTLRSEKRGYVQAVDANGLIESAIAQGSHIRLYIKPGDYVYQGQEIAALYRDHGQSERQELEKQMNRHFIAGARRTPRQDLGCGLLELVEIAIRALSPGINDPHTALNCIDALGSVLCELVKRDFPGSMRRDADGQLRLIAESLEFLDYLHISFLKIRECASFHSSIYLRLFQALEHIAQSCEEGSSPREAIQQEYEATLLSARAMVRDKFALAQIEAFVRESSMAQVGNP